jgi:hypothetical protein
MSSRVEQAIVLALLVVLGLAVLLVGLMAGLALGGEETLAYPTPEEAVQAYVGSTREPDEAAGFHLKGTLPVWNGALVVYTLPGPPGTELLGYRLAKHGGSGWRADTGAEFAVALPAVPNDVIDWHVDSRVDHSRDLNGPVETTVVFGRLSFSGVSVVEVTFDQGQTHQTSAGSGFFAVAAVGTTDVRVIRALTSDGSEIKAIDRTEAR